MRYHIEVAPQGDKRHLKFRREVTFWGKRTTVAESDVVSPWQAARLVRGWSTMSGLSLPYAGLLAWLALWRTWRAAPAPAATADRKSA